MSGERLKKLETIDVGDSREIVQERMRNKVDRGRGTFHGTPRR